MAGTKTIRLSRAARDFNVGISTLVDVLESSGHVVERKPNTQITGEQYALLEKEFEASVAVKQEAEGLTIGSGHMDVVVKSEKKPQPEEEKEDEDDLLIFDKSGRGKQESTPSDKKEEDKAPAKEGKDKQEEDEYISAKPRGLKIIDKVDLDSKNEIRKKPEKSETPASEKPAEKEPAPQKEKKVIEEPETTPAAEKKEIEVEEKTPTAEEEKEEVKAVEAEKPSTAEKQEPPAKEEQPKEVEEVKKEEQGEEIKEKEPEEVEVQKTPQEATVTAEADSPTEEISEESEGVIGDEKKKQRVIEAKADKLQGLTVLGKIDLPSSAKKKTKAEAAAAEEKKKEEKKKRKRKRVKYRSENQALKEDFYKENKAKKKKGKPTTKKKEEVSEKEVEAEFKKTIAKLSGGGGSTKGSKSKYRKVKRDAARQAEREQMELEDANILKVAEFISTNELATLMEVNVNEIIAFCMGMGLFVSINQRLDGETISLIAEQFDYVVEFTSAEEEVDVVLEEEDNEADLKDRAPIVTIMGHVDHGKTSLLDYIRHTKVASGEAGGITQHIGAYSVETESNKRIVFLDTPGHEAFTAMRARGAKVTDVVIIVIAADDSVMPQTIEAINHAQVAGVPIVIAINKVDRPNANPNKIKEELSKINILVEEWGGKVQCQEISAKTGQGVDDLLEMVVLESDILELKANPNKKGVGTIVEASLDKGRGYISTVLVQSGTLQVGDVILSGHHFGKVKAMTDSLGQRLDKVGPATPIQVLGLDGAPQAGDKLNVMESEREARDIANKRQQITREQSIRATKRTTLSDIGKRIAMGNFQQLNVVLKGDVDGSVEALSDSLQKLSTEEVEVNIIHKAVGSISENDVLLASASDAIVIGFQVRPTPSTRRLAERENVEIRLYSVIYHAINEVKDAMEGLLSPDIEEDIVGNVEIREVYKISKVGTVAGCYVTDGYIKRNSKIRIVRDGIVVYGGESGGEVQALKRFKDDVSEVKQGFECGISIKNFNDIKEGDVIEVFEQREVKRTLN